MASINNIPADRRSGCWRLKSPVLSGRANPRQSIPSLAFAGRRRAFPARRYPAQTAGGAWKVEHPRTDAGEASRLLPDRRRCRLEHTATRRLAPKERQTGPAGRKSAFRPGKNVPPDRCRGIAGSASISDCGGFQSQALQSWRSRTVRIHAGASDRRYGGRGQHSGPHLDRCFESAGGQRECQVQF